MTRSMLCPLTVLLAAGWSAGQPPKDIPPGPKDPGPPPNRFPGAARAAQEEVELLEAQLATKEAYIKAAEVAVDGPRVKLARLTKLVQPGMVALEEVEGAKVEVRLAEAQLAIRKAEANEVAVRLKHARARLDRAGKRAAAEATLRALTAAAEKARAEAARSQQEVEQLRKTLDKLMTLLEPESADVRTAQKRLKEAVERAGLAQVDAELTAAELDHTRTIVEGGAGK